MVQPDGALSLAKPRNVRELLVLVQETMARDVLRE
jgi:hypothetical protein